MQIDDALERIAEIHRFLGRGQVYRGYRALPVALTALTALFGAWLQPRWVAVGDDRAYVLYWLSIAVLCGGLCAVGIVERYLRDTAIGRRQAVSVIGQFLPCLAVGMLTAIVLPIVLPSAVVLLPGLWALLFGLGILASRPYLPHAAGWVGCFYLSAGAGLLWLAEDRSSLQPWAMGVVFGTGQTFAAAMLYWNIERTGDG